MNDEDACGQDGGVLVASIIVGAVLGGGAVLTRCLLVPLLHSMLK